MKIRFYSSNDIIKINELGNYLHKDYNFSLDEFSYCLICEEDNIFIGFINYSIIYERAEIVDIIINPNYRKNGYGKKLLEEALKIIKSKNCNVVTLEVNSKNKIAINFYTKFDFKIKSIRKNYYTLDNYSDGYLMVKELEVIK